MCFYLTFYFSLLGRQHSRPALLLTGRRLGEGGGNYRLLEPQTVNFPQNVIRSYTPACAKPLVVLQSFLSVIISTVEKILPLTDMKQNNAFYYSHENLATFWQVYAKVIMYSTLPLPPSHSAVIVTVNVKILSDNFHVKSL